MYEGDPQYTRPFSGVNIHRSITRRQLDRRLDCVLEQVGSRPPRGWIRTIREALGMSTVELAHRMAVSQPRASQLERAEVEGYIRLSTLRRAAEALGCQLVYVLVPDQPLEHMVLRQALRKAAAEAASALIDLPPEDRDDAAALLDEQLEIRAQQLVDSHGLWREASGQDQGRPPLRP
jgi:predicted DNA-binding mobile mystery protein A